MSSLLPRSDPPTRVSRSTPLRLAVAKSRQPAPKPPLRSAIDERHLYSDVTRALGVTPVVRLNRVHEVCRTTSCWLKLESCNPGGSIKEKNAACLVDMAETSGALEPGGTIVASSSGNFGVGLAIVGAVRGYRVLVVIDAKTTAFFRKLLTAYGAELIEVDEKDASGSMQKARMKRARELAASISGAWYPCQHLNPLNRLPHAQYTAREIRAAFGDSLDAVVVGVSTAGQIMGIATALHREQPDLKIIAVDVQGSAIFSDQGAPYKMTGVGLSFRPPNLDYSVVDRAYVVPESLSYSVCLSLARREGMLLGASSGAIVAAGMHVASELGPDSRVLMINPDRGDRYIDTVYDADWRAQNGFETLDDAQIADGIGALDPVLYADGEQV